MKHTIIPIRDMPKPEMTLFEFLFAFILRVEKIK